jgi:hypothetical protein
MIDDFGIQKKKMPTSEGNVNSIYAKYLLFNNLKHLLQVSVQVSY